MLIEEPVSHIDRETEHGRIDWLDLSWQECLQRALKRKTRAGLDIRILLRIGITLRHGDVLLKDADSIIAVNVPPVEVLIIEPRDSAQAIAIAYRLGDLHVPIQLQNGLIVTIPDGPIEAAILPLGVLFKIERRIFQPTLRSSTELTLSPTFQFRNAIQQGASPA